MTDSDSVHVVPIAFIVLNFQSFERPHDAMTLLRYLSHRRSDLNPCRTDGCHFSIGQAHGGFVLEFRAADFRSFRGYLMMSAQTDRALR